MRRRRLLRLRSLVAYGICKRMELVGITEDLDEQIEACLAQLRHNKPLKVQLQEAEKWLGKNRRRGACGVGRVHCRDYEGAGRSRSNQGACTFH